MLSFGANDSALKGLFKSLSDQLICEPIELEDKIIIPIAKMDMGLCTSMNQTGENKKNDGQKKHVAGGGAGLFPVAVLVILKGISGPEGVKVVALSPPGESLSDIAHDLMEKMIAHKNMQEKRIDDMAAIKIE
jgi:uncharacterized spore protein YtfJ